MKYCPKCGCPCEETETVCMICQTPLHHNVTTQRPKPSSSNASSQRQPKQVPVNAPTTTRRVQPASQKHRPVERPSNRIPANTPPKKRKKQKSLAVPIVLLSLVALSSLAFILYYFLGKSDDTLSPLMSAVDETEQTATVNSSLSQSGEPFFGIGQTTDTLYISDGKQYKYSNGNADMVYTYEFSKDGRPISRHKGYADNRYPADTTFYIYAEKEFTDIASKYLSDLQLSSEAEELTYNFHNSLDSIIRSKVTDPVVSDDISYELIGIEDGKITAHYSAFYDSFLKYNSLGKIDEQTLYHNGEMYAHYVYTFLPDGKVDFYDYTSHFSSAKKIHGQHEYGLGSKPVTTVITETYDDGKTSTAYYDLFYDDNDILVKQTQRQADNNISSFLFHYQKISVPHESLDELLNIYDHLGISYVIESDTTSVKNTMSEEDMSIATAEYVEWKGDYSLSDIKQTNSFYIKYDDSTFDRYSITGYWTSDHCGLFLKNSAVDKLPIVDKKTNLVLTWDGNFVVNLFPVSSEVNALSMDSDGVAAYGTLDSDKDSLLIRREDNTFERIELITINGLPAADYPAFIEDRTVNPYGGMRSATERVVWASFERGSTITLGVKRGSGIVEEKHSANITYYDINPNHHSYTIPDQYTVKTIPTVDGYSDLDFSDIPNGKYAMILQGEKDGKRKYIATVIDLQQ